MNEINLTDKAASIVKADVSSFKSDKVRYADYAAEMGVTLETVAAHVAIFREAFKSSRGNKNVSADEVKAYATKVRNGLNRTLGKSTTVADRQHYYLTTEGVATLSAMDHEDMLTAILAEIENRSQIAA